MEHIITDYSGMEITVFQSTIDHIKERHPEITNPLTFVKDILKYPIIVLENDRKDTHSYYNRLNKHLFKVAYVQVKKQIVKSAHITDRTKDGKIVWLQKKIK